MAPNMTSALLAAASFMGLGDSFFSRPIVMRSMAYLKAARAIFRRHTAHERNEKKLAEQTHRGPNPRKAFGCRLKRTLPKAPNRRAHKLSVWREARGIL